MLAIAIGLCVFYALACLCLGALLQRLLEGRVAGEGAAGGFARLSTSFLLGQGLLANVWLLLALGSRFSPPLVAALLAACVLAGLAFAPRDAKSFASQFRSELSGLRHAGWLWKGLVLLSLLVLIVKGVGALLPPEHSDALSFYLALPKAVAASHRLIPLPGYETFTRVGLQGELHFAALMSLGNVQAAKLFQWSNSLATALMLLAVCEQVGLGARARVIALVMLITSTAFVFYTSDGKVDVFGAAMGMGAFYWAVRLEPGRLFALRFAGLFTGLAVIAKISYLPVLLPAILLLVTLRLAVPGPGGSGARRFLPLAIALAALGFWVALPAVPHVIKSALLFQEPLAPLFGSAGQAAVTDQRWFTPEVTRWIVLTYPLVMVIGQYPMQYGNLSPLTLAFAPLLLLLPRPPSAAKSPLVQLTAAALLGVLAWAALRPSVVAPRYILAALLALIPAAACAAAHVYRTETRPRLISAGVAAALLFMAVSALNQVRAIPAATYRYLSGRVSDCEVSGANCSALAAASQDARPGDRVFMGIYYRYWLRPDLLQCVSSFGEQEALARLPTPEARWEYLIKRGFRYLVIDESTHAATAAALAPDSPPGWVELTTLMREGKYAAYRLASRDPSRAHGAICRQAGGPAWEVMSR